ncbi:MAG: electron transport complex subunit RsxD [Gammaproteobacteria bacterium HGW-Gammaproteobacteria-3]|nr:MAG: electron transport complex subunit RsxD [Gammaproteobacteria bacterium HGW-Gammaproteobacteria-3]
MKFSTVLSPHLQPVNSVDRVMLKVLLALIPGIAAMAWFFGIGIWINIAIATVTAALAEAFILKLRGRPVIATLKDLSAMVTAVLLAISLPVIAPWWITVVGSLFAIVIAKHLYGGLGYNPFNPAMAGYVLLLVSFPLPMTAWPPPVEIATVHLSMADVARLIFLEQRPDAISFDALTRATPLDSLKTQLGLNQTVSAIRDGEVFGLFSGKGWEWVALAYLVGGLWLLWQKVIAWQIPAGLLLGLGLLASLGFSIDSEHYASPLFHLSAGATLLGAFFIATDPVTAAATACGRIIYGLLIGALIYLIRIWGGYPDAVAFSVLLANLCAPALDYVTRPRVFGHRA